MRALKSSGWIWTLDWAPWRQNYAALISVPIASTPDAWYLPEFKQKSKLFTLETDHFNENNHLFMQFIWLPGGNQGLRGTHPYKTYNLRNAKRGPLAPKSSQSLLWSIIISQISPFVSFLQDKALIRIQFGRKIEEWWHGVKRFVLSTWILTTVLWNYILSILQIINWENLSNLPSLADRYLANLLCEPRSPCHQSPSLLLYQEKATHQILSMP